LGQYDSESLEIFKRMGPQRERSRSRSRSRSGSLVIGNTYESKLERMSSQLDSFINNPQENHLNLVQICTQPSRSQDDLNFGQALTDLENVVGKKIKELLEIRFNFWNQKLANFNTVDDDNYELFINTFKDFDIFTALTLDYLMKYLTNFGRYRRT